MSLALPATAIATASTYLEGAVDVTLRKRLLMGWLDKSGRIRRDATGKDYNWLIQFKNPTANTYVPYQQINFNNDNFNVPAVVTPEWFYVSSGMDVTEELLNSGQTAIVNNYFERVKLLASAMEIYIAKSMYLDGNSAAGANRPIGINTVCKKSGSITTDNTCRIAPPVAGTTYAGLDISLGSQGGTWSNNAAVPMNPNLGTDWPDGQGDPSNAYDATSPRLYNENTNRWVSLTASAANSDWRTNCIAMLSRANTDLRMNTVESMMPNIHLSGSERHQAVKDSLRLSFRDTMVHDASQDLGYYNTLEFEGAAIDMDHECPSDRTFSLCAASLELFFYGMPNDTKARAAGMTDGSQRITGGIFATYGPERPPGSLQTVWLMFAGGNTRLQPRWIVCHHDFTLST